MAFLEVPNLQGPASPVPAGGSDVGSVGVFTHFPYVRNDGDICSVYAIQAPQGVTISGGPFSGPSPFSNPVTFSVAPGTAPGTYSVSYSWSVQYQPGDFEYPGTQTGVGNTSITITGPDPSGGTPSPGATLRDNNATYPTGDKFGVWIADANTGGDALIVRYAPDSGRWVRVILANPFPFVPNQCLALDSVGNRLYALQYDSGTQTTILSVIDTTAFGSPTHGLQGINGLVNTLTIQDQLGGVFNSGVVGLVWDPISRTLWMYADSSANNASRAFYSIDTTTGATSFFDVSPTLTNNVEDIFCSGGFLYLAEHASRGWVHQFPIAGGMLLPDNGPIDTYDGGVNTGFIHGFQDDPSTGNIIGLCNTGSTSLFGNSAGYLIIQQTPFAVLAGVSSSVEGQSLSVDEAGNVWFFDFTNTFTKYVGGTVAITKPPLPGGFGQPNNYGTTWLRHLNGNPNLFIGDAAGIFGALYTTNDLNSEAFFVIGNDTNAPNITHVDPFALIADPTHASYPLGDQNGIWIASSNKAVRYSPEQAIGEGFQIVPLANSSSISHNGMTGIFVGELLFVYDQPNGGIWVIDTTGIGGDPITGVNGILRFVDMNSTFLGNTVVGLVYEPTSGFLFAAESTNPLVYQIDPVTFGVTTFSVTSGNAVVEITASAGTVFVIDVAFNGIFVDPFTGNNTLTQPLSPPPVTGLSASSTNLFVGDSNTPPGVNGFLTAGGGSFVSTWSPAAFTGDAITFHGLVADGTNVFIVLYDATASTNYVAEVSGDGTSTLALLTIPSPFQFNLDIYNQTFLDTPGKIFVSDDSNKVIWSGTPGADVALSIQTDFPYLSNGSPVALTASIDQTNSSLLADASRTDANIVADSSLFGALGTPVVVAASLFTDSSFSGSLVELIFGSITANSSLSGNIAVTGPVYIAGDSLFAGEMNIDYAIRAACHGDSSVPVRADLSLDGVPVSPTKLRVLFPEPMVNDANLNSLASYTVQDLAGNPLTIVSATPDDPPNPTVVSLVLSPPFRSGQSYTITVSNLLVSIYANAVIPNSDTFQWIQASRPEDPITIPLSEFTGEVQGDLFGMPAGLVFFSPALNAPAANSVIQVEEVDVCTYAFDSYTFPQPIDPLPLFTFGRGHPDGSLIGPGTGTVLWAPFPRNTDVLFELGFSPTLTNDLVPLATDDAVTVTMQTQWALGFVALLNDPGYVLYAEQVVVPPTPPLFITANNAAPIPGGGTTILVIRFGMAGDSSLQASLGSHVGLQATIVADSDFLTIPVATQLAGAAKVTAGLSVALAPSKSILADSHVAARVT